MKRVLFCLVILSSFAGCGRQIVSEELAEADSLIAMEKNDSAYQLLSGIKGRYLVSDEDKAHYYLLMTRAAILTGNTVLPDSCIDYAIKYYEKRKDCRNLADAYYYKAYKVFLQQDYSGAIRLLKKAEVQAVYSNDIKQQFKVSELIAHINEISGNNSLYLKYARQSLGYAHILKDKTLLAYSFLRLSRAFRIENLNDSANYYIQKTLPYLENIRKVDLAYFLTEIGYSFKYSNPLKAKGYFLQSLKYKEMTYTLAHLADIYNEEGNREEAYKLWKRALVTTDDAPKDDIVCNLLEYDIQNGNTDNVLEKVNEIMDIKDSIQDKLKNDTLKDLQLRFDHEVETHELDRKLDRSIIAIVVLIAIVIASVSYVGYKRHRFKLTLAKTQIQIDNYTEQIHHLKESNEDVKGEIAYLIHKIEELMGQSSKRMYHSIQLYNDIKNNCTTVSWSKEDYDLFIEYYDAIDHATVRQLRKTHKGITPHNLFYLLLDKMGKGKDDICHIMGLSPEGLRSMKYRVSHWNEKANGGQA